MSLSDPWPGLELRHLVAFRAVARAESFRAAAAELGFTQGAVSQQLALLERRLGRRLVERRSGRRGVELTPAGELLLRHTDELLRRVALARSDLQAQETGGGVLRVGTFHSLSVRLLPRIAETFTRVRPGTVLELLEERSADRLLELLGDGELDLAFVDVVPATGDGRFEGEALFDDPYVVAVPATSPHARRRQISLDDLHGRPVIGFSCVGSQRRLEQTAAEVGRRLNVVLRSDETATLNALVAAGAGVAVLPRLAVDPANNRVVAVPADPRLDPRPVALMWNVERERNAAAAAFVAATLQTVRRLARVA
jgi:DNA-binding transcriptional LysR family regulator